MEMTMYQRMIATVLSLAFLAFMAGCNTMEGLGKDIKSVGQSLQGSAEKHESASAD